MSAYLGFPQGLQSRFVNASTFTSLMDHKSNPCLEYVPLNNKKYKYEKLAAKILKVYNKGEIVLAIYNIISVRQLNSALCR